MYLSRSAIPVVLLFGILGVLALFLGLQWNALSNSRMLVDHSHRVIEAGLHVASAISDAQSAGRGYVLTGNEGDNALFNSARSAVAQRLTELQGLVPDNPDQTARVQRLAALWEAEGASLARIIDSVKAGDLPIARARARALVTGDGTDALMKEIRTETGRLEGAERTLLDHRLSDADAARQRSEIVMVSACGISAIGLIVSILALSRRSMLNARDAARQRDIARELQESRRALAGEVSSVQARLEDTAMGLQAALRSAPIVVGSQDRDLRYRWVHASGSRRDPTSFLGRTDEEVLPDQVSSRLTANKRATLDDGEPRNFELFVPADETDEGRWYDVHVEPTRDAAGMIDGITSVAIEVTERKQREQHVRLLMREIAHRSKNTLAVAQAVARQTAAASTSIEEFLERFADRLDALGRAHSLLVDEGWAGAEIADLVRSQLGHYAELVGRQVFLDGPAVVLPTEMIQNIGLALHELSTNAGKYGALSTPDGRVDIVWTATPKTEGGTAIEIRWAESGGPPVSPPTRRGFGQIVIERMAARAVDGEVDLAYDPSGLRWTLRFDRPVEEE